MENLLIRELKIEDTEEISTIYESIMQKPIEPDFGHIIEQALGGDNASFVAVIDGRVVGFMISYVISGGFGMKKSAWVANLGVAPKYMGQGIGEKLAKEIFELARKEGITDIYTSVRWDSTDLLSFFKRLGFNRSNFINLRKVIG